MAKKFVRGITDIKTINNQDFDTNNVNDLLSDGEHNYIHRKKGKTEEYHNLTNNLKTLLSVNTDLLTVINDNDTHNSATLHPKHDVQKEQSLESTRSTITIAHGANGTTETTKVDTNPEKVLEHSNLLTDYGISKTTSGNTTTLKVSDNFINVVNSKQNALMAGDGINLNNNTISIIHTPQSTVDCNKIITTQYLKTGSATTNIPPGAHVFGILSVVRIDDMVQQTYQDCYVGSERYIRSANNANESPVWSPWKKIVTESTT